MATVLQLNSRPECIRKVTEGSLRRLRVEAIDLYSDDSSRTCGATRRGTTKLHRLEENIGSADLELRASDLGQIEDAAASIIVQGARYPEHLQQRVGR
jgi:aryl-alcohol dehydrogenase-like predicted oxidoreductase